MKEFRFGDYVWYKKEGWRFIGMDEDGAYWLCRPQADMCFDIIDLEQVYVSDEDNLDTFLKENGETLTEYCERKGIPMPKEKVKDIEDFGNFLDKLERKVK